MAVCKYAVVGAKLEDVCVSLSRRGGWRQRCPCITCRDFARGGGNAGCKVLVTAAPRPQSLCGV